MSCISKKSCIFAGKDKIMNNILGSHFIPSEHPYQIIFDVVSKRIGMQIGTLVVLDGNVDAEKNDSKTFRTMPVVTEVCKEPIIRGKEDFNLYMNMPYIVDEAMVWENCRMLLRICTEDNKHISINKFNYLVHEMYVSKLEDLKFYDTPSFLLSTLDRLGVTVEWPKDDEQIITLVRAELHSSGPVKYWCQSKMEDGLYFYANEKDGDDMCFSIIYQAYNYFRLNSNYTFKFKTSVPKYQEWLDKLNGIVNDYCRRPK